MAISSTLPVTSPYAPPQASSVSVRDAGSLARQIPALAAPSVAVTIGAAASSTLLYNAAGLLRSLVVVDAAGDLPSGANSNAGSAGLPGNLETVLGLNSESGFLGTSAAIGSLGDLSSDSAQALKSVLADGQGNDQALKDLLAQALNASSSGLDRNRSAASVVNATGVLRSGSSDQALKALDALRTSDLGLAATGIDAGRATTGTLDAAGLQASTSGNADNQSFQRTISAKLEAAVAEIDVARPRRRAQAQAGANELLLSDVSLATSAAEASGINAEPTPLADSFAEVPSLPSDALARLAQGVLRRTDEAAAAPQNGTEPVADATPNLSSANRSSATVQQAVDPVTNDAGRRMAEAPPSETPTTATAPATPASVTREPRYAEIAASLNMGAAVYRYQTSTNNGVPPGDVDPLRTVLQIRATPAVNKVA